MDIRKLRNEKPIDYKMEANPIGDKTVVYLYGDVEDEHPVDPWTGDKVEGDFITPKGVREIFDGIATDKVEVHINSYGGSAFAGIAIKNYIESLAKDVTFYIDGIGASAASIIPMAGKVKMYRNSLMMIHKAWTIAIGNSDDMLKQAEVLEKLDNSIITNYESKFKGDNLRELISNETWLTADEALACGLCDEIVEPVKETPAEEEKPYNKTTQKLEALLSASFNFIKNKGDVR